MLVVAQCIMWVLLKLQTDCDMFIPLQQPECSFPLTSVSWQSFRYALRVHFRAVITLHWRTGKQSTNMKESSGVYLAWKVLLLLMCVLLLLTSAGLGFLLVRQTELTEELVRLDAQMQELSQSCRLQAAILPAHPGQTGELKKLQRSRRNQDGEPPEESLDKKDMMMMMTYSMVPVRHTNA